MIDEPKKKKRPARFRPRTLFLLLVMVIVASGTAIYVASSLQKPQYLALITDRNTYLIEPDGKLYRDLKVFCMRFVWSPDGTHFLCQSAMHNEIVDTAVTEAVAIPGYESAYFSDTPWSPDSQHIILASEQTLVKIVNTDGEPVAAFEPDVPEKHFVWSAPAWSSGQQIAFTTYASEFEQDVYVMNADGTHLRHLLRVELSSKYHYTGVFWSPDASRLLFVTADETAAGSFQMRLTILSSDGRKLKEFTAAAMNSFPAWSPDSTRIVWSDEAQISIYDTRDGEIQTIGEGEKPVWAGSSERLVFLRDGQVYFADIRTLEIWQPFYTDYKVEKVVWQP